MKNGFTQTQNGFINQIDANLAKGISFTSSVADAASTFQLQQDYVLDTYLSFIKQKMVIA